MAFFLQATVICNDCGHVPFHLRDDGPVRQYRSATYYCLNKNCCSFKVRFRVTFPLVQCAAMVQPEPEPEPVAL
jgi:hypothetical protein